LKPPIQDGPGVFICGTSENSYQRTYPQNSVNQNDTICLFFLIRRIWVNGVIHPDA